MFRGYDTNKSVINIMMIHSCKSPLGKHEANYSLIGLLYRVCHTKLRLGLGLLTTDTPTERTKALHAVRCTFRNHTMFQAYIIVFVCSRIVRHDTGEHCTKEKSSSIITKSWLLRVDFHMLLIF